MKRNFLLWLLLIGALIGFCEVNTAQAAPQERVLQPVIINGARTEGVTLLLNGAVQNPSCASPQPYTAIDRSYSGWACFDGHTGTWLLNALPPESYSYEYPETTPFYPYGYGPYDSEPYGFLGIPGFSFGFGFDHEHHEHEHHQHEFQHGHGEHGEHGHERGRR
ncbi:MAG TPA: hypothetical protein VKY31_16640 [Terriglobia bacterium]|nr:hypothetical protein [Terriglobia bacterium]